MFTCKRGELMRELGVQGATSWGPRQPAGWRSLAVLVVLLAAGGTAAARDTGHGQRTFRGEIWAPGVKLNKRKLQQLQVPKRGWQSAGGVVYDPRTGRLALQLCKKERRQGTNGWTLPKGRVDPHESLSRAARREVLEEAGIHVAVPGKIAVHRSSRALRHYYLLLRKSESGTFDHETAEVRWVTSRKAKKLLERKRDRDVVKAADKALKARRR